MAQDPHTDGRAKIKFPLDSRQASSYRFDQNSKDIFMIGGGALTKKAKLFATLLGASTILGCQGVPFLSGSAPRMVVNYGTVDFDSNASLSVTLNVEPLLAQTRKVLAAPTPTASGTPAVGCPTQLVATITGQNSGYRSQQTISLADATNGLATLEFYNLPADTYTVTVIAEDASGQAVKFATQSGVVVNNSVSPVVHLTCQDASGSLTIDWNCPDPMCGASPSPTPTPTPAPPVNLKNAAVSFDVDPSGNVYVLGHTTSGNNLTNGVIMKVDTAGNASTLLTNFPQGDDIAATAGYVYFIGAQYNSGGQLSRLSLSNGSTVQIPTPAAFTYPADLTRDYSGTVDYGIDTTSGWRFYREDGTLLGSSTIGNALNGECSINNENLPEFVYNWSNGDWIAKVNQDGTINQFVWQDPVYGHHVYAIAGMGPTSTKFLIGHGNDPSIQLWDSTNPGTQIPVLTESGGYWPTYIRRGANGKFYVFAVYQPAPNWRFWATTYTIASYDFDPAQNKLINEHVIVDTHP